MSYPERRPYATTVTHSGYCAKPQPLTPKPPTDALRILNSQIGFDQPRNNRPRLGTANSGRLPAIAPSEAESSDLVAQRALANPTIFPDAERRPDDALAQAKLEDPFQYATGTYHTSQQGVLNAELRLRVEKFLHDWQTKVQQLNELIGHYPSDCAMVNYSSTEGLKTYFDVYRCTEDLHVPVEKLIADRQLNTQLGEMDDVESVPVVPLDNIRRSLDSLLTSNYLLAPLDQYVMALDVYDRIIASMPEEKRAGRSGNNDAAPGAPADLICPSTTAVVLHERFHYDPGAYAKKELKKSEDPLAQMEARVEDARRHKEAAIDAINPVDALRSLHAQVDFSNDLLLLNKARMDLVRMHSDDVRELRAAVAAVLEDAKQSAELLQERVQDLQPRIRQDLETLEGDITASQEHLRALDEKEREAEKQMREAMRVKDDEEKELWEQMQELMKKMVASAEAKEKLAAQRMSMREARAKEYLATQELLKTQASHHERLSQCEELVTRWEQGSDVYGKYVEAFIPKLLKRVNQLEDEDEDLNNREAQDYVRRFEMFAYGAEEARAKRSVQADRMRLMQRSSLLDQAVAPETLDPQSEEHLKRYEEAGRELEEVTAYMQYIRNIEEDRRQEVEPVLHRVLAYNAAMRKEVEAAKLAAAEATSPAAIEDIAEPTDVEAEGAAVDNTEADGAAADLVVPEGTAVNNAVAASNGAAPVLTATVEHPYVTASKIGLAHEEAYVEKHRQLNDLELAAQEEKVGGIRRSKAELEEMAKKYKNGDYVRKLLLGQEDAAAAGQREL